MEDWPRSLLCISFCICGVDLEPELAGWLAHHYWPYFLLRFLPLEQTDL